MTTGIGKQLEDISHAHIISLMYKPKTSNRGSNDTSIGFDRSGDKRRDKLASNEKIKGKYHVRNMLKDIFGFAEHQEEATYGLGYNLTLTRKKDNAVIDKAVGIADARNKIDHIY